MFQHLSVTETPAAAMPTEFVLDPAAQVLHNGQMIFDGTKAYRRPDTHPTSVGTTVKRFARSVGRVAGWYAGRPVSAG
jgi:branched-subunit amino acid aminotransferase/4-amino-4-deoxychorismate lyase